MARFFLLAPGRAWGVHGGSGVVIAAVRVSGGDSPPPFNERCQLASSVTDTARADLDWPRSVAHSVPSLGGAGGDVAHDAEFGAAQKARAGGVAEFRV
jgi:hypothetical protein